MFLPYEIKFLLRALQPLRRRPFDFKWFSAACLGIAMIGVSSIGQMDGVSIAMLTAGLLLGIFPFFLIDSRHGGSHPKFPYSSKIYIKDIVMVALGYSFVFTSFMDVLSVYRTIGILLGFVLIMAVLRKMTTRS